MIAVTEKKETGRRAKKPSRASAFFPSSTLEISGGYAANMTLGFVDIPASRSSTTFVSVAYLSKLTAKGRDFLFRSPQTCIHHYSDEVWSHEIPALGIRGHGATEKESLANLARDLEACWLDIAQANDDELTRDARDLKARLLSAVAAS